MPIYTLLHQVRRLDEELCGNGRKYSTEDVLFSGRGKRIVLGKLIAEGGEGSVFTAHAASASPLVAKLYHPNQRMRWREQKLRLMCSRPIRSPWREILYDELRRFVGVLMPRADGVPLGAFAFHAELLQKQFPSWTRYDLTRLCLNLSESVHTLHRYGVVLGDLHPGNVMVSPDGSVCWVDADSFQIEDYPCSVGTERFRAPELRGNYGDFLRTRSHDTYALSVLLFLTLTLGLSPFARQGGEGDMREAARKGVLPYPFASYKPPPGFYPPDTPGRYVWSYLPRKLRDALGPHLLQKSRHFGNGLGQFLCLERSSHCFSASLPGIHAGIVNTGILFPVQMGVISRLEILAHVHLLPFLRPQHNIFPH